MRRKAAPFGLWFVIACGLFLSCLGIPGRAAASTVDFVSDTLQSSIPATSTNQTITFRVPSGIPVGGHIVITPEAGAFDIPAGLDDTDLDLATSSALTGTYADRIVGPAANTSTDGVAIVSGTSGSITITLSGQQDIAAGDFVRVRIGTNATYQSTGDVQIINPSSTRSYHVHVETRTAADAPLDGGTTMIAIIDPVAVSADTFDFYPPTISNGLPSGTIPSGITAIEISVNTDEIAKCRFATTSGVSYYSMTNLLTNVSSTYGYTTFHYITLTGFSDGNTYTYYIRCADRVPNVNTTDYVLSFTVSNPLPPPNPGGGGGGGGSGSFTGPGSGGSSGPPYLPSPGAPDITLQGRSYPSSHVYLTKDAEIYKDFNVNVGGNFSELIQNLVQGTYTFGAYARDTENRRSAPFTTTLTLVAGTHNLISNIFIPPTLGVAEQNVGAGDPLLVAGASLASSTVMLSLARQKPGEILPGDETTYTTVADATGKWSYDIDTTGLPIDTYELRARASLADFGSSHYSQTLYVGVGTEASPDFCLRSDLNRDTRVNLVDFSILLFHWNSSDPVADINLDERVNLTDFSIMLYCWSG